MWPEHEPKMHYPYPGNYGIDAADSNWFDNSGNPLGLRRYAGLQIMQFTSPKDKDGREIYEGDVVQWIGTDGKFANPKDAEQ